MSQKYHYHPKHEAHGHPGVMCPHETPPRDFDGLEEVNDLDIPECRVTQILQEILCVRFGQPLRYRKATHYELLCAINALALVIARQRERPGEVAVNTMSMGEVPEDVKAALESLKSHKLKSGDQVPSGTFEALRSALRSAKARVGDQAAKKASEN